MKSLIVLVLLSLAGSCSGKTHVNKPLDRPGIAIKEMLDGRVWTTEYLEIQTPKSICQKEKISNRDLDECLFTWIEAGEACKQLKNERGLPAGGELAAAYSDISGQSKEEGKLAYLSF